MVTSQQPVMVTRKSLPEYEIDFDDEFDYQLFKDAPEISNNVQ